MLSTLEQKLTALLAEQLGARAHLDVSRGHAPAPIAGRGTVVVALTAASTGTAFERERFAFNGAQSRRVLPVSFRATLECSMNPSDASEPALLSARSLLLDDVSLIGHGLARSDVYDGSAFAIAAPDPGFRVAAFGLENATVSAQVAPDSGLLTARLAYAGNGEIWPPNVEQAQGQISAIESTLVPLPLAATVASKVLRAGQSTTLEASSLPGTRLATLTPPARGALRLAVSVLSDVSPAERGVIPSGGAGSETGVRLIDVANPVTLFDYRAPAQVAHNRVEYVAVHLATPDGLRGVLLGTVALQLVAG